jgi:hypothetical protein
MSASSILSCAPARARRTTVASLLALIATLALTGSTLAVTWAAPVQLTTSGNAWANLPSLATTGGSKVIAIFSDETDGVDRVYIRLSADAGATWDPAVMLSSAGAPDAAYGTVAAVGQTVDVTWSEGSDCDHGPCPLYYATSTNGGTSFGAPLLLSPLSALALRSQVARCGDVVAVAWTDGATDTVQARVSTNGGTSFGTAKTVGTTTNNPRDTDVGHDGLATVAVGNGVVFVAYYPNSHTLKMRRTVDNGATWKKAKTVSSAVDGLEPASIVASGLKAVIAYTRGSGQATWTAIRRTIDKGATWKAEQTLAGSSLPASGDPVAAVNGSTWRVAYLRCSNASCDTTAIYLRSSTNGGKTWAKANQVVTGDATHGLVAPYGVTYATKIVVAYFKSDWDITDNDVWVRTGS